MSINGVASKSVKLQTTVANSDKQSNVNSGVGRSSAGPTAGLRTAAPSMAPVRSNIEGADANERLPNVRNKYKGSSDSEIAVILLSEADKRLTRLNSAASSPSDVAKVKGAFDNYVETLQFPEMLKPANIDSKQFELRAKESREKEGGGSGVVHKLIERLIGSAAAKNK